MLKFEKKEFLSATISLGSFEKTIVFVPEKIFPVTVIALLLLLGLAVKLTVGNEITYSFSRFASELKTFPYRNLFVNGNFRDDLNGWKHNGAVAKDFNGTKAALFEGDKTKQKRLWQTFNVVSGQVYYLL